MSDSSDSMVNAMMILAATKAGAFCKEAGYQPPTEEQTAEMARIWRDAFTAFVPAWSDARPDREPTQAEMEQVEEVVEGAAQGAVLRVLGAATGAN